jgi:hypothetical protein
MNKKQLFYINHGRSIKIAKEVGTAILIAIVFLLVMIWAGQTYPY